MAKNLAALLMVSVLAPGTVSLAQPAPEGRRIAAHTRFLASDLLEGRGVGTRGGAITEEYLASVLASYGVQPAGENGTWFQRVPMVGVTTLPETSLTASGGGKSVSFALQSEFVATTHRQQTDQPFDAELVFVGHGIVAPEENWDDFKGVDVRNRIIVLFTNEPQPENPEVFKGKALTYKGRWTYKFEEAARQGALGALIVHTTPTAGYGWEVVRNSWSKEEPQMKYDPAKPALSLAGWLTEDAGEKLFALAGRSVAELLKAADARDFRPMPLGIRLKGAIRTKVRSVESRNVIGILPGSERKDEAVAFTAHWDHLGVGLPVDGDAIYNGAVDNATGCAIVLEIARIWSSLENRPRRSALFVFVTAEESGLLGSLYYSQNPTFPAAKTALNINYDAFMPFGRTKDVVVSGAERTTAWPLVQEAARRHGLEIQADPRPEQGSYYRSDHFSLAKAGIPAFSVKMGTQVVGKPADFTASAFREFNAKHYHQPSDEYRADWDFGGMEQAASFGYLIGLNAANTEKMFTWNAGDEFLAAREASLRSAK